MSKVSLPIGEALRGYAGELDAQFDKDVAEAQRLAAYTYVDQILEDMQTADESPWITKAEQRFAEWDEKVISPLRDVLAERDGAITENAVEFGIPTRIPLEKASSAVNIKLRFPVVTGELYSAYSDAYQAGQLKPTKPGGKELLRPESWERRLAERAGSMVLSGRNILGVKRLALSVPDVQRGAARRLGEVSRTVIFQGVQYRITQYWGDDGRNALAEGGVMNPANKNGYAVYYDPISPFQYNDIAGTVIGQFDGKNFPAIAEGEMDEKVRTLLLSEVRNKAQEVERKYEFTDKVLQLIIESNFYKELAARGDKVTTL